MKDNIFKLINDKPKHYSKIVKNSPELLNWVKSNTKISSNILAEEIYSALHDVSNVCHLGNIKKFHNITSGFAGCGPASKCQCVREAVSANVSKSKSKFSQCQIDTINDKRRQTNIKKYGVSCVAQTEENRQKFKNWYADPKNVELNLQRIKKTNIEKYGIENCKSLPEVEQKIIATCLSRYGVENVSQIPSTKAKLRARTAEYKLTGHLIQKGYDKFSNYVNQNYNFTLVTAKAEYKGIDAGQQLEYQCNTCDTRKTTKFYYSRGITCEVCNPPSVLYSSKEEQAIFDYISKDLGVANGYQHDRKLISPYELDMVFPDQKIAIEYGGLYWHSELSSGKDKKYHYNKLLLTNEQGYRLITIFSDEWVSNNDIVKSKLSNIFKKTTQRYYARKLTVKLVDFQESKNFQNLYHLQGYANSKIDLGLHDGDTLVALMTFSNGRAALNSSVVANEYELVRFVTNKSSVVGGASKLLSYFIKHYQPVKITSYADNRWSEGNVYRMLNFQNNTKPTIGYWYVDKYQKRLHRYNFTKQSLIKAGNDPSKTEWEIMRELGYDRIWDCGHQQFVMTF